MEPRLLFPDPPSFMDLPRDVRDLILAHLFGGIVLTKERLNLRCVHHTFARTDWPIYRSLRRCGEAKSFCRAITDNWSKYHPTPEEASTFAWKLAHLLVDAYDAPDLRDLRNDCILPGPFPVQLLAMVSYAVYCNSRTTERAAAFYDALKFAARDVLRLAPFSDDKGLEWCIYWLDRVCSHLNRSCAPDGPLKEMHMPSVYVWLHTHVLPLCADPPRIR